jgi:hypothetical protein
MGACAQEQSGLTGASMAWERGMGPSVKPEGDGGEVGRGTQGAGAAGDGSYGAAPPMVA